MRRSAEVVVVGCGVIGASIAYHLALGGCRDVLILERGPQPGVGSTSRATGGFRAQFGTEIGVRLSLLSREKLLNFREEFGIDPGYRQCGYLFIASSEGELNALRKALAIQRAAGLTEVEEVTPGDVHRLNPAIDLEGILGGTYCPTDGFVKPMTILEGYLGGARRLGVRVEFGVNVLGLEFKTGTTGRVIEAVRTSQGEISCGRLVNAAGAWAGEVLYPEIEIPVKPVKRQVAVSMPTNLLPEDMPMTIFTEDGFHFRVRDGRVLFLWPFDFHPDDPFDTTFEESWLEGIARRIQRRSPSFAHLAIDRERCWAGLYEMTPDKHVILGRTSGIENLYLANGSSGHGVMHSPAIGQLMAELMLDGSTRSLDIHPLRPTRFAEKILNESVEFL